MIIIIKKTISASTIFIHFSLVTNESYYNNKIQNKEGFHCLEKHFYYHSNFYMIDESITIYYLSIAFSGAITEERKEKIRTNEMLLFNNSKDKIFLIISLRMYFLIKNRFIMLSEKVYTRISPKFKILKDRLIL